MPSSTVFNLLEACRQPGCPICRLEQQHVRRYIDQHFYESVNSPRWRDQLRLSLGFCHEHAWLGVDQRLGDALGYSIIYRDVIHSLLKQWETDSASARGSQRRAPLFGQLTDAARGAIDRLRQALTPRKPCPVCVQRDHTTETYLGVLAQELGTSDMTQALQASEGLCLSHLRRALEQTREAGAVEQLIDIHRQRWESLRGELDEFIRKNDYQAIQEGFGKEGDAWLRAIATIAGARK